MTPSIDYTNKSDLISLRNRIDLLPTELYPYLAAFVVCKELMPPKGFSAKIIWWSVCLGAWLRGVPRDNLYRATMQHEPHGPPIAYDTVLMTMNWLVNGKNAYDPKSAGGFCYDELQALNQSVHILEEHTALKDGTRNG